VPTIQLSCVVGVEKNKSERKDEAIAEEQHAKKVYPPWCDREVECSFVFCSASLPDKTKIQKSPGMRHSRCPNQGKIQDDARLLNPDPESNKRKMLIENAVHMLYLSTIVR